MHCQLSRQLLLPKIAKSPSTVPEMPHFHRASALHKHVVINGQIFCPQHPTKPQCLTCPMCRTADAAGAHVKPLAKAHDVTLSDREALQAIDIKKGKSKLIPITFDGVTATWSVMTAGSSRVKSFSLNVKHGIPTINHLSCQTLPEMAYCKKCNATFSQGIAGDRAVKACPSHYATLPSADRAKEEDGTRTVCVFIDGTAFAYAAPGFAVYFGPGSKFNCRQQLPYAEDAVTHTTLRPELEGFVQACQTMRTRIAVNRYKSMRALGWSKTNSRLDVAQTRLVVLTDSHYLIDTMSKRSDKFSVNQETGEFEDCRGNTVPNSKLLVRCSHERKELERIGVKVELCGVPSSENAAKVGIGGRGANIVVI
ncbi:hypothetical protein EJ06DRAFT_41957 [Trichodelitschia bisporula]|uniref:RNase H type-1 domain-containing protein n=1 Tax=Trichodelitschia bisporula TaxID=703511 RepID=A0A6G1HVA7_9PEZI|nr:hypothetical protein EJ06DRAFT_41957 [Trichodelitschia bisporula]